MRKPATDWDSEAARHCLKRNVDHRALGHYLRQQREAVGLSHGEMARALDITPVELLLLEAGGKGYAWTPQLMERFLQTCQEPELSV